MKKLLLMLTTGSSLFFTTPFAQAASENQPAVYGSGIVSPVQSPADPEKLKLDNPVMLAGSDAASASFQTRVLPEIISFVNAHLPEYKTLNVTSAMMLDPTKLTLQNKSDVRVYFVGEGAGYHNAIGFNTWNVGQNAPKNAVGANVKLIFPDASSTVSSYNPSSGSVRTSTEPLMPGDFVNLGSFNARTVLDFFLISNGVNGGTANLSGTASRNPDGLNHMVTFAVPDSPMLMIAFEDMVGGGDKDFNDVIIAVDIGRANVANLTAAPEPAFWMLLAGFLGIAAWFGKSRQLAL